MHRVGVSGVTANTACCTIFFAGYSIFYDPMLPEILK